MEKCTDPMSLKNITYWLVNLEHTIPHTADGKGHTLAREIFKLISETE